jgi:ornithine cyclodeaminase/alanine dehydrogenase-like protein (mu-crystallin family)
MIYISEEESAALVMHELAFEAAREALVAATSQQSRVFPAVLGRTREATNTFSIKSGSSDSRAWISRGYVVRHTLLAGRCRPGSDSGPSLYPGECT